MEIDLLIKRQSPSKGSRIFRRGTVRRRKKPNRTEPKLTSNGFLVREQMQTFQTFIIKLAMQQ